MATYAELKENISLELGLDETASGDEDTLLGRRINQAVREVLKKTQCRVISASTVLTADQGDYDLDTDILAIKDIKNSDNNLLERVSVEEVHDLRRGSQATGSGVYKYAVDGANLLMVYPIPDVADTLTVYYVPKPTEMSSGSHDPSATTYGGVPVEYHDLLEFYAMYRMASYDDDQSSGVGQLYKQQFDQGVKEARAELRRRGGRRLGPVRRGRRLRVPRDPSVTWWY